MIFLNLIKSYNEMWIEIRKFSMFERRLEKESRESKITKFRSSQ